MPYTLAYQDRYKRVEESSITSDTSNSIAFASIPDHVPTKLVVEWTGKQLTKLFSSIYMGANLMFPEEANEIIWQLLKAVHQPIPLDEEGGCINYAPSAPFIQYELQDPFSQPDFVPDGYLVPPFHYNSDFAYPEAFGFLATDVMVATDAIPIFGDWGDVLGLNFPTIKLTVFGQGQIELDFLSIQLGGYAVVKVGSEPNIFDIVDGIIDTGVSIIDLQADIESLPIESDLVVEHEVPIDAPTGTNVYIVFIPKISVAIDFFGMGGGLRQVGLCGLEMTNEEFLMEDIRLNDANCTLEKRIGGTWIAVAGWDSINECVVPLAVAPEAVEAVLPTSTTIINITNEIEENTTNITEITEQITVIQAQPIGGNVYPDYADYSTDELCAAASYVADKIITFALETIADSQTMTGLDFVLGLLGSGGYIAEQLNLMWAHVVANWTGTLATETGYGNAILAHYLYCENFDIAAVKTAISADSYLSTDAKDVINYALDSVNQAQIALWAFAGGKQTEHVCDCASTTWKIAYNFDGSYVPDASEDAVYSGNSWQISGTTGLYVPAQGYVAQTTGVPMVIYKNLPQPCYITKYSVRYARGPACSAADIAFRQRGASGTGAEAYSADFRITSGTGVTVDYNVLPTSGSPLGADMKLMSLRATAAPGCTAGNFKNQFIRYVVIEGHGNMP